MCSIDHIELIYYVLVFILLSKVGIKRDKTRIIHGIFIIILLNLIYVLQFFIKLLLFLYLNCYIHLCKLSMKPLYISLWYSIRTENISCSTLESYQKMPIFIPVKITEDVVKLVTRKISGSFGPGGTKS